MTMPHISRRTLGGIALGSLALSALPKSAAADQSVPGVEVGLGQDPGALVVSGRVGRDHVVTFADVPPGTYNPVLPRVAQITRPLVIVVRVPGREPLTSDPILPVPAGTATSACGYRTGLGGAPFILTVAAGSPPIRITVEAYQAAPVRRAR